MNSWILEGFWAAILCLSFGAGLVVYRTRVWDQSSGELTRLALIAACAGVLLVLPSALTSSTATHQSAVDGLSALAQAVSSSGAMAGAAIGAVLSWLYALRCALDR